MLWEWFTRCEAESDEFRCVKRAGHGGAHHVRDDYGGELWWPREKRALPRPRNMGIVDLAEAALTDTDIVLHFDSLR